MPIEDAEADALLDFPDRIGQTRLRDEQRFRGFGYRPLFGHRNQIAQLLQCHGAVLSLMPNEKVVGLDENESVFVQTDHHNRGSV